MAEGESADDERERDALEMGRRIEHL